MSNCEKCQFLGEGATHGEGEVEGGCVKFFRVNSTLAMWLANVNWLGVFVKKFAEVKSWVMVKNSIFWGLPMGMGWLGRVV